MLKNVRLVEEMKLLQKFQEQLAMDTGMVCFGIDETVLAFQDLCAVETIIVYEEADWDRYVLKNPRTNEEKVVFKTEREAAKTEMAFLRILEEDGGGDYEIVEQTPFIEWATNHNEEFGCKKLELITDVSTAGNQFKRGFGGVGAFLRYKIDFRDYEIASEIDFDDDEFEDGEWEQ